MEKATYILTITMVLALGVTLASSASVGSVLAVSYPAGNSPTSLGSNMTKAAGTAGANMTKAGNMTAGNLTKAAGTAGANMTKAGNMTAGNLTKTVSNATSNSSNPLSRALAPIINPIKKALKGLD